MNADATPSTCPCGSHRDYADCCRPLHEGAPAPDAEALMRSRYSAYVMQLDNYLLISWHPQTRPQTLQPGSSQPAITWLGLRIKRHAPIDADHAVVEFVARFRVGGASAQRLHEISRFVREGGRWLYLDGHIE